MGVTYSSTGVIPRVYPQYPPACNSCPPPPLGPRDLDTHTFIHPTNASCLEFFGPGGCTPAITSLRDPAFLFLYSLWAITAGLALLWAVYRRLRAKRAKRRLAGGENLEVWVKAVDDVSPHDSPREGSQGLPAPLSDFGGKEPGARLMTFEYLRATWVASVARALWAANGFVFLVYYLTLTADFYVDCDNGHTLDSACYFGSFRLMGDYQANTEAFFVVWLGILAYALAVALGWRAMLDFVRVPCEPEAASHVRVWVQEDERVLVAGSNLSYGMRVKRSLAARVNRGLQRCALALWDKAAAVELTQAGRACTVPVLLSALGTRYFVFECRRYMVPGEAPVSCALKPSTVSEIRDMGAQPQSAAERTQRASAIGENAMHLDAPVFRALLAEEFFSPFYAYQMVIYLMWIYWTYWWVGIVLLSIVVLSGVTAVVVKLRNLRAVYSLAEHKDTCEVFGDNGIWVTVQATVLVPGDVVRVRGGGWTAPADLALVEGSCAADESSLTGETMPASKSALPRSREEDAMTVNIAEHRWKPHALFAGTTCLEASDGCRGVVLATGVDASRGQMLVGVLFPPRVVLQFDEEFAVAIALLLAYALLVVVLSFVLQASAEASASWTTMFMFCVFAVSQVVSPLLRIALVAGQLAGAKRLQANGIGCVDTSRIDVAGQVSLFAFDKTGTLTQDGLQLVSVLRAEGSALVPLPVETHRLTAHARGDHLEKAMATCHSLGMFRGQLLGNAVDVAMFGATGWALASPERVEFEGQQGLEVVRRLQFDRARRTMGVVVQSAGSPLVLYVKGAPESVFALCGSVAVKRGTATDLAAGGGYVLAMASRPLVGWTARQVADAPRDELERALSLLGLVVFRNELKADAAASVAELQEGKVRTVMVTGDNLLTGVFVARQAGLLQGNVVVGEAVDGKVQWSPPRPAAIDEGDDLALSGDAFDLLLQSGEIHRGRMLQRVVVFARTSPAQKVRVVKAFMDGPDGQVVAYAGDGSNDLGALQQASVGLSLGTQEASVVATFTSKSRAVASCVELVREGRASVATSVATYKLLIIYGLLFSLINLASFYYAVLMPLLGYLFIDLLAVVPLTFFMTLAKPLARLTPFMPDASLLGARTVLSVIGVFLVSVVSLSVNLAVMTNTQGYVRWPSRYVDTASWWYLSDNWESTTIFFTVFMVFIFASLSFSFGTHFRQHLCRNVALQALILFLFLMATICFLGEPGGFSAAFHMANEQFNAPGTQNPAWIGYQAAGGPPSPSMGSGLRNTLWVLTMVAALFQVAWERVVVQGPVGPRLWHCCVGSSERYA